VLPNGLKVSKFHWSALESAVSAPLTLNLDGLTVGAHASFNCCVHLAGDGVVRLIEARGQIGSWAVPCRHGPGLHSDGCGFTVGAPFDKSARSFVKS